MKLIFTGIQGCGKGTQARLLQDMFGFTLVEMGSEFRQEISSGSDLGKSLVELMNSGKMINEQLGKQVMQKALEKYKDEQNVIFDGFIRLAWNLEICEKIIPDYTVVFFHLDQETAKARLMGRMFNPETSETFPAGTTTDPKTGMTLIQRDDDTEKVILSRIDEFVTKALPIVQDQRARGIVIDIDADQSVEKVFTDLQKALGLNI